MAVYSWGLGKNGQLGSGLKENETLPTKAKFDKATSDQAIAVSAGGLFTCFCTKTGKVFSFGCGKHGRLGTGDEIDRIKAIPISDLGSRNIVAVSFNNNEKISNALGHKTRVACN